MDRHARLIDGKLFEVWSVMAIELCIQVGEDATLHERIICEIDTAHNVADLVLRLRQMRCGVMQTFLVP
jgi:hypothetical protein